MNKTAYYTGYMEKKALSLPDMQTAFNKFTINPAMRTALLAGAGYFGTKYATRGLSNMLARRRINAIQDPRQRQMAWQQHKQRLSKIEPWLAGAGALAAGALPAVDMFKAFKPALAKYRASGKFGDLTAPMLNNKLPASFDKYR